jgi:hypothetical protein
MRICAAPVPHRTGSRFLRALKIDGLRQVVAEIFDSYHKPI